ASSRAGAAASSYSPEPPQHSVLSTQYSVLGGMMAEIVAGFGVPHTPMAPAQVQQDPGGETAQLYRAVAEHLDAVQPDVLVVFDSDHLTTFFFDNLPTFCVGVAPRTAGPNDSNAQIPRYQVPVSEPLARAVQRTGLGQGFDLALTQEFEVDHSIL